MGESCSQKEAEERSGGEGELSGKTVSVVHSCLGDTEEKEGDVAGC